MPCWYFDKNELKNTPSFRDGIESDTESRYRREGARFLMECGNNMGLRHETMSTGVVFYHRFYMFHSFNEFPRYMTATCCLFLAGKVEETPKKCKDIIKAAKAWLESKNLKSCADQFNDESFKEIMIHERILLQTIKFDLQVDHPYGYLLKYAKTLKGNQEHIRSMVQMAWTFINDSFCTTLCLQWEPEIIAIALMYLTSKLSKLEVTDWNSKVERGYLNWWDQFVDGLGIDILEDICHQILDLYATQSGQGKPGALGETTPTKGLPVGSTTPTKKPKVQTPPMPVDQTSLTLPPTDLTKTGPTSSKLQTRFSDPTPSYQPYPPIQPQTNYFQQPPPPPSQPTNIYPPQDQFNTSSTNFLYHQQHFQQTHYSQNGNGMPYYPQHQHNYQHHGSILPPPPPPSQEQSPYNNSYNQYNQGPYSNSGLPPQQMQVFNGMDTSTTSSNKNNPYNV